MDLWRRRPVELRFYLWTRVAAAPTCTQLQIGAGATGSHRRSVGSGAAEPRGSGHGGAQVYASAPGRGGRPQYPSARAPSRSYLATGHIRVCRSNPSYQEPSSVEKILEIDEHIGCAMSGLIADARTLVEHARVETQSRPFGVSQVMMRMDLAY